MRRSSSSCSRRAWCSGRCGSRWCVPGRWHRPAAERDRAASARRAVAELPGGRADRRAGRLSELRPPAPASLQPGRSLHRQLPADRDQRLRPGAHPRGSRSVLSSSRTRSIRLCPPASSMPMLREVSTRIGTTASEAPSGSPLTTGRMMSSSNRISVMNRSPLSVARRGRVSGAWPYAYHATIAAATISPSSAHQGRGLAKVTSSLWRGTRSIATRTGDTLRARARCRRRSADPAQVCWRAATQPPTHTARGARPRPCAIAPSR